MSETTDKIARQPMDLDRAQVPEGRVHVIEERCKECNFCITYCPADVLAYSVDTNYKGYRFPIVVEGKESSCILCRFCDMICPELAIFTTDANEPESEDSNASQ
jgi:2-oxoglutarate ferredoxin oxidoreductase subunit delta